MKVKSLTPKFLITENVYDPIIKTSEVVVIIMYNNQICFTLKNNTFQYWTFENKETAEAEYIKIKSVLNKISIN